MPLQTLIIKKIYIVKFKTILFQVDYHCHFADLEIKRNLLWFNCAQGISLLLSLTTFNLYLQNTWL